VPDSGERILEAVQLHRVGTQDLGALLVGEVACAAAQSGEGGLFERWPLLAPQLLEFF
jgi:hypothetical protein